MKAKGLLIALSGLGWLFVVSSLAGLIDMPLILVLAPWIAMMALLGVYAIRAHASYQDRAADSAKTARCRSRSI